MAKEELTLLQTRIWKELSDAVSGSSHPWRVMNLATVDEQGGPQLRQVVLRSFDCETRQLLFYTDPRTPKWSQLLDNQCAEVLFWNPEEKEQLRCRVTVVLHREDELAHFHQKKIPPHFAGDYAAHSVPGSPLRDPAQGQELGEKWNFGVVVLAMNRMDWLQLGHEGHRRACFRWADEGLEAQWIQP